MYVAVSIAALQHCSWRHVRDQVFGSNPWCAHTTTQDGRTGHKDTPTTDISPYAVSFHRSTRHAAPDTLRPIQRPMPVSAHAYGDDCARKLPTLNASPCPVAMCEPCMDLWGGRTCEEEVEGDEGGGGSGGYEEAGECHGGNVHVRCRRGRWKQLMRSLPPALVASGVTPPLLLLLHFSFVSASPSPQHAARHKHRTPAHGQTGCVDGHTGHSSAADQRRLGIAQAGSRRLTRTCISLLWRHLGVLRNGGHTGAHPRRVGCGARYKEEPCRLCSLRQGSSSR